MLGCPGPGQGGAPGGARGALETHHAGAMAQAPGGGAVDPRDGEDGEDVIMLHDGY